MRVVFMGSPPFAGPVLDGILASPRHETIALVTRPDKPRGRGMKIEESPLVRAAAERDISVLQPLKARDPEFVALLRALSPDVIVVASYGEILKADLLALPPHGCLNVHASLLPRHRGASPIQAAILAGDDETGVSVQRMVQALDEGDVLVEKRTPIEPHENAGELLARLALLGARAAVEALDLVADDRARFVAQDPARATYARKISKADGIVDWTKSAIEIERLVRAFTPWPAARTSASDAEIVLLDVRARADAARETPGTVIATKPALLVATGDGAIEIRALKPAGKGRLDASAWLNGARIAVGAQLGASELH